MRERIARGAAGVCALLLAATFAAGCASRGLQVQEYVLESAASADAAPAAGVPADPIIGVGPIDVPGYLRRPEIVSRRENGALETRAGERWGEDLASGVARALATALASRIPSNRVYVRPFPAAVRPDAVVGLQVLRFGPLAGGPVELDVQWMLDADGTTFAPQRFALREPVAEDTTAGRVAAMSRALDALAARVATQLRNALATRERPR